MLAYLPGHSRRFHSAFRKLRSAQDYIPGSVNATTDEKDNTETQDSNPTWAHEYNARACLLKSKEQQLPAGTHTDTHTRNQ